MYYDEFLIDTLDRRCALVVSSEGGTLLLECLRFVEWLRGDMTLSAYAQDLRDEYVEIEAQLTGHQLAGVAALTSLKDRCLATLTALDDRGDPAVDSNVDPARYRRSFRFIEASLVALNKGVRSDELSDDHVDRMMNDVISLFDARLCRDPTAANEGGEAAAFLYELREFAETHLRGVLVLRARRNASPGISLEFLDDIVAALVSPESTDGLRDEFQVAVAQIKKEPSLARHPELHPTAEKTDIVKQHLRRVHVELRALLGTALSHRRLVARFKTRCVLYDRRRLRELVMRGEKTDQEFVSQREQILVNELARYLFDCGVWALVRVPFGHHEFDVIGTHGRPILVEAKVYIEAARQEIIGGFAQLHAYLNMIEGTPFQVREAHYVVFRLRGPIYDLPRVLRRGRHTIYAHIVDLGESAESGSRQPKPSVISAEDLIAALPSTDESPGPPTS